jgi:hypothetical protein
MTKKNGKRTKRTDSGRSGAVPRAGAAVLEPAEPAAALRAALEFESWVKQGKTLTASATENQFAVGDWLVSGEDSFRTDKGIVEGKVYDRAEQLTGMSRSHLRKSASIARNVPAFLRSNLLTYSHHVAVAKLPSDEAKRRALAVALRKEMTVVDFVQYVAAEFPDFGARTESAQPTARLTVTLSPHTLKQIHDYAKVRGEKPGELAGDLLGTRAAELADDWTQEIERFTQAVREEKEKTAKAREEKIAACVAKKEARERDRVEKKEARERAKTAKAESKARAKALRDSQRTLKAQGKAEYAEAVVAIKRQFADTVAAVEKDGAKRKITTKESKQIVSAARKLMRQQLEAARGKTKGATVVDLAPAPIVADFRTTKMKFLHEQLIP